MRYYRNFVYYFALIFSFLTLPLFLGFQAHAAEENSVRFQLISTHKTVLSSQVSGKIKQLDVNTGDAFTKGQVLVAIDCATHQAKRKKVLAELNLERTKLKVQKQLEKLGSGSFLDTALVEAKIQQVKADLHIIDITLQRCSIKAPFTGRVIERAGMPYQYVDVGQPILEIIDNQRLEVVMIVPSSWLSWLALEQPFFINVDENQTRYQAKITRIGAHVDSASQSVTVVGSLLHSDDHLVSGMSGSAIFEIPESL